MIKLRKDVWIFVLLFVLFFTGFLIRFFIVGYGVGSGGNSYYSQLVSLVLDGDVDIRNQYELLPSYLSVGSNPFHYSYIVPPPYCPLNHILAAYSIGPAFFWFPFFIFGHILALVLSLLGVDLIPNGFSSIEQIFTMFGSIFYGTLGLYVAYRFVSRFYEKNIVLFSLLSIVFGFSVIHYIMIEPSIAHALTIFTVSVFIYYFYDHRHDNSYKKWIILGILGGLMMLSKWPEGFFLFLPFYYFLKDFFKANFREKKDLILKGGVFVFFVLLVFSPQFFIWKYYTGNYFSIPQEGTKIFNLFEPWNTVPFFLFSFHHSLLVSTPIIFLSFIGAYFYYKKQREFALALIFMMLILIFVNAGLKGAGGTSFGARRLIDSTLIFVLFLSALLSEVKRKQKGVYIGLISIIVFLVLFNLIYLLEYNLNIIDRNAPVDYITILSNLKLIFGKAKLLIGI
jgi:hypothetical protein